jgi:hypothetical protein
MVSFNLENEAHAKIFTMWVNKIKQITGIYEYNNKIRIIIIV